MSSDQPVGFGLIGFGAWGRHHAKAITETADAQLRAIAAKSEASCDAARTTYPDAFVTADYRELLARDDVAVVDVVLPTFLHHEVGVAALRAGKHLLLEKPMAATAADCRDILRAAREADRVLSIGHEFRLSSQWGRVKSIIESGDIGELRYVLVELSRRPYRLGSDGWRYDIDRVGNWILEEPIHFFDLARWYLTGAGDPQQVSAMANACDPARPELQDNFSALMKWPDGTYAVISQTLAAFEHHQTVKVTGTDGAVWAGWSGAMDRTDKPTFFLKLLAGRDGEVREVTIDEPSGELFELRREVERMVAAIRGEQAPAATGEDGLWSVAMCLAAQESVDRGVPVDLRAFVEDKPADRKVADRSAINASPRGGSH